MADEKKPNFALLIGKKLDEKDGTEAPDHLPDEAGEVDEAPAMEDSAVADFMAALKTSNVKAAKQALKDLIQLLDQSDEEV